MPPCTGLLAPPRMHAFWEGLAQVDKVVAQRHISAPFNIRLFEETPLANSRTARKRARQGEKRRRHNASLRSMARTAIKKVQSAIQGGNYDDATAAFQAAVPIIDRMTGKGLIHRNNAARHKSRLNAHIKALKS